MKTKIFYLLIIVILPMLFYSCSEKDAPTSLEISANEVNFTKTGGEESVTITTNQENWVATSPLELSWLTLTQSGNQLSIKANINPEGVERKGYILVNSGDAAAKISIVQSAGDVILNLSVETVNFAKTGGVHRIDVVSNQKFNVEVDVAASEWLKATYMEGAGYFTIAADSHTEVDSREGKIIITAGSTVKEVTITQKGNALIFLPFIAKKTDMREVMLFEAKRGSVVTQLPGYLNTVYFNTESKDFPLIIYNFNTSGNYSAASTASKNKELFKGEKFEQFMADEGFEKVADMHYMHKEYPYEMLMQELADGIMIETRYSPKQDKDYPTFTVLPAKGQLEWGSLPESGLKGKSLEFVKEAEAALGSTLNTQFTKVNSGFYWFDPSQADQDENGFVARAYWFYLPGDVWGPEGNTYVGLLNSARTISNHINRAWWYDEASSKYYITKEFKKLLTDEGFVFMTNRSGYDFYSKANNGVLDILAFRMIQFSDYRPGEDLIDFQVFKNASSESAVSIMTNKNNFIRFNKQMDEKIKQLEKAETLKRIK